MRKLLLILPAVAMLAATLLPLSAAAAPVVVRNPARSGWATVGHDWQVQGAVTVPTVDCAQVPNSATDVWVGLDGQTGREVERVGVVVACVMGLSSVSEYWGNNPGANVQVRLDVHQGDRLVLTVRSLPNYVYAESIRDVTTGQGWAANTDGSFGQNRSAECATERVAGLGYPVVRGGVQWSNCVADGTFAIPGFGTTEDVIFRGGQVQSANPRYTQHSFYTTVTPG